MQAEEGDIVLQTTAPSSGQSKKNKEDKVLSSDSSSTLVGSPLSSCHLPK